MWRTEKCLRLPGIEIGFLGRPVLCLVTVLTEPFRLRWMKLMQLMIKHEEEIYNLNGFSRKVSRWSGFGSFEQNGSGSGFTLIIWWTVRTMRCRIPDDSDSSQGSQRPQYSNKHGVRVKITQFEVSIICSVNSSSKREIPNKIMNFKPSVTTLRQLLHAADFCLPES
jgi:hypothetical protein